MRFLGNVLWHFPFFGFLTALYMFLAGLICTVLIIPAPLGTGLMELGRFFLMPFGQEMIDASRLGTPMSRHPAWRVWGWIILILWLPFGILSAIALAIQIFFCCLSIIGLPAAIAAAKAFPTIFNPVGKKCVSSAVAAELARRQGVAEVERAFGQAGAAPAAPPPQASQAAAPPQLAQAAPQQVNAAQTNGAAASPESDSQTPATFAMEGSKVRLIALGAALVVAVLGGGLYVMFKDGGGPRSEAAQPDPNAFAVQAYNAGETLLARKTGSRYRATPFARPDVPVLGETVEGAPLNVTGWVSQPDGNWFQVRLEGGQTAYIKGTLTVTQSEALREGIGVQAPEAAFALVAPQLLSPENGAVFDHFPRRTAVSWTPVPGADHYVVEIQYYDSGPSTWVDDPAAVRRETAVNASLDFNFMGARPGRWRVSAVDQNGVEGPASDWRTFEYLR